MNNNVIPFRKTDRFSIYRAGLNSECTTIEKEKVGQAFMKEGTKKFRLKLWFLSGVSYFVAPDEHDPKKYVVIIPEEYKRSDGEIRTAWHRVGHGEVTGGFIRLKIYLLSEDLLLSLYPENRKTNQQRQMAS